MIYPKKLTKGSHIRVIAPARSFSIISEDCRKIAKDRFEKLGISVSYSKNVDVMDDFCSSSIQQRLDDIHEAFRDPSVDAILTAIGGFNTNQLIDKLDYELIKSNPKILCGFSDITCLAHAITSQTGMVTYSGPHFSSFGMLKGFDYTFDYFKKCLLSDAPYQISPSSTFSDDPWFLDQEKRDFRKNDPFWVLNHGSEDIVSGKLIGGHVRCIASLQGTKFWPGLENSVLFLEEDEEVSPEVFDRMLQSLIHQKDFSSVKAILIGRFQDKTKMTRKLLEQIVAKKELSHLPIIGNLDIGHTTPIITYPIGGEIKVDVSKDEPIITVLKH